MGIILILWVRIWAFTLKPGKIGEHIWTSQFHVFLVKWSEVNSLSHVQLFATSWTVAYWTPPSMGFSRQEYWSGLSFPSTGELPDPGIEPASLASPAHTKHLTSPQSKQEWKKLELRDQRIRACTLLTMTSWQMFGWLQNHPRSHRIYKENPL